MKKLISLLFVGSVILCACNNVSNPSGDAAEVKTDTVKTDTLTTESMVKDTAQTAALYVCPMHADVTSDKPGPCSKCGMDLEKR